MTNETKLIVVKSFHTLIWLGFNIILAYLFYGVLTNRFDLWFWLGVTAILMECAVLAFNNWVCPLTPVARKYSSSPRENFDIYLPNWMAKYNIAIYSVIAGILILLAAIKYLIADLW